VSHRVSGKMLLSRDMLHFISVLQSCSGSRDNAVILFQNKDAKVLKYARPHIYLFPSELLIISHKIVNQTSTVFIYTSWHKGITWQNSRLIFIFQCGYVHRINFLNVIFQSRNNLGWYRGRWGFGFKTYRKIWYYFICPMTETFGQGNESSGYLKGGNLLILDGRFSIRSLLPGVCY
jgi:hypothetical protein